MRHNRARARLSVITSDGKGLLPPLPVPASPHHRAGPGPDFVVPHVNDSHGILGDLVARRAGARRAKSGGDDGREGGGSAVRVREVSRFLSVCQR